MTTFYFRRFTPNKAKMVVYVNATEKTQPAFACSKLTIETLEQAVKYTNGAFEHIWHLVLVFLLLTLNR